AAQVVALVLDVPGDGVDALAVAVERGVDVLDAVVLAALAPAPHDEGRRTELGGEVDVAQHLAQAEAAHGAVVRGEAAVLEDRVAEGVRRHHLDDEPGVVGGLLEAGEDPLALGVVRTEGHDVVVVEGDAPGAELGELGGVLPGVENRAAGGTELVLRGPADGPDAEGEAVVGGGLTHHGELLVEICFVAQLTSLGAALSSPREPAARAGDDVAQRGVSGAGERRETTLPRTERDVEPG